MPTSFKFSINEINKLSEESGVYLFHNKNDKIIYVGKAKNLKKRVISYFQKQKDHGIKTARLVKEITTIEIFIVDSEYDALFLENNLIKSHNPKYNILLKDDKTYPYIATTNERFPKLVIIRKKDTKKYSAIFGPFTSTKVIDDILTLIKDIVPLRTCKLALTEKNIKTQKFKPCLQYHIKNCLAPCIGLQTENSYNNSLKTAENILKGNFTELKKELKEKMLEKSQQTKYEEALEFKKKLDLIDNYRAKSIIDSTNNETFDVCGVVNDNRRIFINYIQIIHGAIRFSKTLTVENILEDEYIPDILTSVIFDLKKTYNSIAAETLTNIEINTSIKNLQIVTPKIGYKKKLVLLSTKNALTAKLEANNNSQSKSQISATLTLLQKDLHLKFPPIHIECFDNSNLQGTNPVASMVCFKNGVPSKKNYRKFNIKTVQGANDFASMYEIVYRRYTKAKENSTIPDLIIIDGGKGQLKFAINALKDLHLYGQVPIISIAKKLEEIYFPNDPYPLHIAKNSPSLKLIQRIRNEAHRFAINFHRDQRSKNYLSPIL